MNNISEFFSKPWWQGISVILTVLGIAVTLFQFRKKKLGYLVQFSESIFNDEDLDIAKQLSISYKNNPIESLRVVSIKIMNYGFLPIKRDDFQEAIQIQLQGNLKILYHEVKSIVPNNLKIVCAQDLQSIFIQPTLLNSKDTFSIKIVYDGDDAQIEPACRIVGISRIKDLELVRLAGRNLFAIGVFAAISIYALFNWAFYTTQPGYGFQVLGCLLLLAVISYISIYRDRMIENL
ncbi:hypothetical protein [Dyadobacter sp. CY356]|uniref:hypothetical protein n=1 Tax=Dyadobacter sp. CY356 TaxID=2906442 RepID=UPI001F3EB8F6|nr:hypothetical protein [Dyadobacter sp. CY356]MCF0055352.1 hypothetical protein [Dyadobacter sp. CY356]